jgi:hypothetical protein
MNFANFASNFNLRRYNKVLCNECESKPGAHYTLCLDCMGSWCNGRA